MLGDCGGKQRPYPYTTAFQRISGRTHAMVINVQVFDRNSMDIARAKIVDLLRERHRLARTRRTTSPCRRSRRWRRRRPRRPAS